MLDFLFMKKSIISFESKIYLFQIFYKTFEERNSIIQFLTQVDKSKNSDPFR
jgi:hypothetical protein